MGKDVNMFKTVFMKLSTMYNAHASVRNFEKRVWQSSLSMVPVSYCAFPHKVTGVVPSHSIPQLNLRAVLSYYTFASRSGPRPEQNLTE